MYNDTKACIRKQELALFANDINTGQTCGVHINTQFIVRDFKVSMSPIVLCPGDYIVSVTYNMDNESIVIQHVIGIDELTIHTIAVNAIDVAMHDKVSLDAITAFIKLHREFIKSIGVLQ